MAGLKKKIEFQLILCTRSCYILLAQGNCFLVITTDLVTKWLAWTISRWNEVKKLLAQQENLLDPDDQTGLFFSSSALRVKDIRS